MMDLREKIARAICGNWIVGDDRPWQQWTEEADAVLEVLAKQEPVAWQMSHQSWGDGWFDTNEAHAEWLRANKYGEWKVRPLYAAPGAQAAVPDGWLRAIDEEMVGAHIGIANASDDYATAKEKLNKLICWHVAVATDPAVNGGWQLVPIDPASAMLDAAEKLDWSNEIQRLRAAVLANHEWHQRTDDYGGYPESEICEINTAALAAAPKPEGE